MQAGTMKVERIAPVGYINSERRHALVSIYNPAILNAGERSVQVVLSIEAVRELNANLSAFLATHDEAVH